MYRDKLSTLAQKAIKEYGTSTVCKTFTNSMQRFFYKIMVLNYVRYLTQKFLLFYDMIFYLQTCYFMIRNFSI